MAYRLDELRAQRVAAGLSLNELARAAVCNVHYIVQYEDGRPCSPREANQIAAALGVSLETLGAAPMGA